MILLQLSYGVFFRCLVLTIILIGEGIGFAEFSGTIKEPPRIILESQFPDEDTDHQTLVHVSIPILILSAIPLLCIAGISRIFDPVLANDVIVGMARSFIQLMVLGWILHPIFVMGMDWPWLVGLCKLLLFHQNHLPEHQSSSPFSMTFLNNESSIIADRFTIPDIIFMTLIATRETVTKVKYTYQYHSLLTFFSIIMSISAIGAFAFLCIIRPEPRWNPQYVIPICGMFMGNCISGVRLTVNHLSIQIMEGGRREIELYLSFGASGWQSVRRLVNEAVGAGVTPLLNSLNVIGLVSIPGEKLPMS